MTNATDDQFRRVATAEFRQVFQGLRKATSVVHVVA